MLSIRVYADALSGISAELAVCDVFLQCVLRIQHSDQMSCDRVFCNIMWKLEAFIAKAAASLLQEYFPMEIFAIRLILPSKFKDPVLCGNKIS